MMSQIDSLNRKISTGRHFQNGQHNAAQIQHCSISKVAFDLFLYARLLRRDILWYTNVRPFHMSHSNLRTPWPIHFKFHRVIGIDGLMSVCFNFEFSFQSYGTLFIKL